MSTIVTNFRALHEVLCEDVGRALHTQIGDAPRLRSKIAEIMQFRLSASQHENLFEEQEYFELCESVRAMVAALEAACHRSANPFNQPPPQIITASRTGKKGRPRLEINKEVLKQSLNLRRPQKLSQEFGVSAQTIRRHALEHGLREPGLPVFQRIDNVHNVRIERLWVDYNTGFTNTWYQFFHDLELSYGLHHENPWHIWLLHHLFLHTINKEAQVWVDIWNLHKMRGTGSQSPREMFHFGLMRQGMRGIGLMVMPTADEAVTDYTQYGVDWGFMNLASDGEDPLPPMEAGQPPAAGYGLGHGEPARYNEVLCEAPDCSLSDNQLAALDEHVENTFEGLEDVGHGVMELRKGLWATGLEFCRVDLGEVNF
ncbi:hypothetical protein D9611_007378 [Ephemerocybe angulata]|uniref:Integrase core domain-containing protein n=1 Tax=Ephemerocybe angulata TaxID=980116 RepID=A0A8H5FKN7_9AGAR|nr:hypothetical protein D9611_007378 [Tulosesus angulatus]